MKRVVGNVVVSMLLAGSAIGTQTANAAWGGGQCYLNPPAENHHCYSIMRWKMTGTEQVRGSSAGIVTSYIDVPVVEAHAFISHEMWDIFPRDKNETWIETGDIGGVNNCCTVYPFWAVYEYGVELYKTIHTWVEIPNGFDQAYTLKDPEHTGDWWVVWGATLAGSWYRLPTYATELDAGAEAASETQPYDDGYDTVSSLWPPNGSEHTWAGSKNHAELYLTPGGGMCGSTYGSIGDSIFGTCQQLAGAPAVTSTTKPESRSAEEIARQKAAQAGDPNPTRIETATGSLQELTATAAPHVGLAASSAANSGSVDTLVVMHGSFAYDGPTPPGHPLPPGSVYALIIEPDGTVQAEILRYKELSLEGLHGVKTAYSASVHHSAIVGRVLAGAGPPPAHTGPVTHIGPVTKTPVVAVNPATYRVVADATTNKNGSFGMRIRPGTYILEARPGPHGPFCGTQRVRVRPGKVSHAVLACSGK
jgi:hypothetical protein